jgi:hypothetical protein
MVTSEFYKKGFLIISNKNLTSDSKLLNSDTVLDTGKIHTFFGELNNYGTITILGEAKVLPIESYNTKVDYNLFKNIVGPIEITNEMSIMNEVSIT